MRLRALEMHRIKDRDKEVSLHYQIAQIVNPSLGEAFSMQDEVDEFGQPTGIVFIRVRCLDVRFTVAVDMESEGDAIISPAVMRVSEKLEEMRTLIRARPVPF